MTTKLAERMASLQYTVDRLLLKKYGSEKKIIEARQQYRRRRMWPGVVDDKEKDSKA